MRADTRQTGNWYKSCIGGSPTLRHNYRSQNTTERVRLPHLWCVTAATPTLVTMVHWWKTDTPTQLLEPEHHRAGETATPSVCHSCHTHSCDRVSSVEVQHSNTTRANTLQRCYTQFWKPKNQEICMGQCYQYKAYDKIQKFSLF